MDAWRAGLLAPLVGAVVGGTVSVLLNRQLHAQPLERLRTAHKTGFAAEDTARHFLGHRS